MSLLLVRIVQMYQIGVRSIDPLGGNSRLKPTQLRVAVTSTAATLTTLVTRVARTSRTTLTTSITSIPQRRRSVDFIASAQEQVANLAARSNQLASHVRRRPGPTALEQVHEGVVTDKLQPSGKAVNWAYTQSADCRVYLNQ